ncbi:Stealth CR1 domain-containing protein [Mongoliibacter ruber]|uniref:Stealth-like protein n=1 Tax=Mongoliibacter ruber TaxID=1750599 RepID=A0A2T0WHR3_9BACT|nr:Stealth CR1 domain-containing protein [Mongoliibacter ruber]PRY86253.1 Stealth-like protein [Mongoliibacter ruber]
MGITNTNIPIDAVITWVNGEDPAHQKKIEKALGGTSRKHVPGAEKTRFGNANELLYCVLSILKFAPFIRKIYIVTDNQNPNIDSYIKEYFPQKLPDLRIVDHKEIFRDHLEFLPTFNSRAIEALLWKIEGISDNFIFLSDDMFIVKPLVPENLFIKGKPVIRGKWLLRPVLRNLWNGLRQFYHHDIIKNKTFQPKPSFHVGQWNAAKVTGFKWKYFFSSHTPHTVNGQNASSFFQKKPGILIDQIKYKFRHNSQFNCAALYYHLEINEGNKNFSEPSFIYLHPYGRNKNYIDKKLKSCEKNPSILFMNVQSLELCSIEQQKKITGWLEKTLEL